MTFQHNFGIHERLFEVKKKKQKPEIEFLLFLSGRIMLTRCVRTVSQAAGQTTRNILLEKPDGMERGVGVGGG